MCKPSNDMIFLILIVSGLLLSGCSLGLPPMESLDNLQMVAASQVYDKDGQLISKLFEENRTIVPFRNMSPFIRDAIVANEDTRFYSHMGVDPLGILRAVWNDIRSGTLLEGGSTITQQLAKNMFLTQERTFSRKIKEVSLALMIERRFSKQEILEAYLNQVYFGEGAYGVEAASQVYFGKHNVELTLAESAMLAGLPRGPELYSPYADLPKALERRSVVLAGMVKGGYITPAQAASAEKEPLILAGKKKRIVQASYFLDYVAKQLVDRYGANRVYKSGLKIYTTLDISVQKAAETVLGERQGAIVAIDPRNGYVKALVGGRNYQESQINRAFAEVRQPGSAFKPFVYATAVNQGVASNAIIVDEPITIAGYAPQNYDKKFLGPITMSKALRMSINVAAVKMGRQVGMDSVLSLAKSLGITTLDPGDNQLASALGGLTRGVNLFELTSAYAAFANNGIFSQPIMILKVVDGNDQVLEEAAVVQRSVLPPETAYIMTTMMRGVIESGTGTPAALGRPAAGKTGTTDNYETAWFIGYTPELLAGIYVGNDDRSTVGISGTQVAGMWGQLMQQSLVGINPTDFAVPPKVITGVPICTTTGQIPDVGCKEVEYSSFILGTQPLQNKPSSSAPNQPRWRLPLIPGLPGL